MSNIAFSEEAFDDYLFNYHGSDKIRSENLRISYGYSKRKIKDTRHYPLMEQWRVPAISSHYLIFATL